MNPKLTLRVLSIAMLALFLSSCGLFSITQKTPMAGEVLPAATESEAALEESTAGPAEIEETATGGEGITAVPDGPVFLTGQFEYSNDIIEIYYVEHAVSLLDMTGFVLRDEEWELPVVSQVMGYLDLDTNNNIGVFQLSLPARPEGQFNDVDNDETAEEGVQIFSVGYNPNLYGDPFSTGDDRSMGWPSYLASVKTDTENQDEVIAGMLVVWAADETQSFPSGFGEDGLLFTGDDPIMDLPAGYSVIDLDADPFEVIRDAEVELTLYEPADVAIKDFSADSYTEAFDQMFEIVSKEYAFNDVEGKAPDWDALYAELQPKVAAAEEDSDPYAYFLALQEFTFAFRDGHVGLGGGQWGDQNFFDLTDYGYGFAMRELSDGSVIVVYVLEGGPAETAGIQVGDEIVEWNGEPIADAISAVAPLSAPHSSDFDLRYQQVRYLGRAVEGDTVEVTFQPATGAQRTVTLDAVMERQSFSATSMYLNYDPNALPVEFEILPQGIGYVSINSNYDDLNLVIRLFERALQTFQYNGLPGIIIDMRLNSGGAPLGLAGFLTDQEIEMGQLEYYSDATGQFEPEGPREKFFPNENQYRFDSMVLLVGSACYSACEIEAYGFSQVPGMVVMGHTPSGGVEAEVARGQFLLPEGMSLQIPTGRFILPDGSIFLEGEGVPTTVTVPVTAEGVLSGEDVVLQAAIEQIAGGGE